VIAVIGKAKAPLIKNRHLAVGRRNPKILPLITQIALIYTDGKASLPRKHGDMEKIAVIARDRNVIAVTGKLNLTADHTDLHRSESKTFRRVNNGRLLNFRISFLI